MILGLTSVLFFLALLPMEAVPEIPVDIDWKPFFIPYMFIALLPWGGATAAASVGAALGEGIRDIIEGYEIDDPIGFIGYVVGFMVFGALVRNHPKSRRRLFAASLAGACVQAAIEGSAFLIVGEGAGLRIMALATVGNTITHGFLLGYLPLVLIVPALHGRIERFLGYAPLERGEFQYQPVR